VLKAVNRVLLLFGARVAETFITPEVVLRALGRVID
jgi:hypothetical protein